MITTKNTQQTNEFFRLVYKGSGSAYGGKWNPKKPGNDRYLGKPGEIKVTYDDHGMKRWTKIGVDGRAVKERHFGDHRRNDKHTVPPRPHYIMGTRQRKPVAARSHQLSERRAGV